MRTHLHRASQARHCKWCPSMRSWLSYTIALIWAQFYNKCRNYKPSRSNVPAVWIERAAEMAILPRFLASGLSIRCVIRSVKRKNNKVENGQQHFLNKAVIKLPQGNVYAKQTSSEYRRPCIELNMSDGKASEHSEPWADIACRPTAKTLTARSFSAIKRRRKVSC